MAENDSTDEGAPDPAQVEQRARDMGWMPKEDWEKDSRRDPNHWVDAGEFVKRGETFVPFLQHERKKLRGELEGERRERLRLEQELRETRESVGELKKLSDEMAKDRNARRKVEIQQELKAARDAGDDVRVAELQNELGETVKATPKANGSEPPPAKPPTQPAIQPWVQEFIDGNDDFFKNGRKLALFNAVMIERRQAGDTRVGPVEGTALLNEARDEVEKALSGNSRRQAPPRTEESRPEGAGGGRRSGEGYADLPPEARAECDKQEKRFTGPTKLFKDQAAWRKHYVKEYFSPSAAAAARRE